MQIMIIDIGSNTIKYDVFSPPSPTVLKHRSTAAGIIQYIKNGVMSDLGLEVLENILNKYASDAVDMGCTLFAFATASLRRLNDPNTVIREIKKRTGIHIDLVSGETESALSLQGMLSVTDCEENGLMMDMGGGSTELNKFHKGDSVFSVSCPFGALSLKQEFVQNEFPNEEEIQKIYNHAHSVFQLYSANIQTNSLYMVGGCAKAIAKILFYKQEQPCVQNSIFKKDEILSLQAELIQGGKKEQELLKTLFPDRYPVLIPAITAYIALLDCCNANTVCVSSGGVREGYLAHIYNKLPREGVLHEGK